MILFTSSKWSSKWFLLIEKFKMFLFFYIFLVFPFFPKKISCCWCYRCVFQIHTFLRMNIQTWMGKIQSSKGERWKSSGATCWTWNNNKGIHFLSMNDDCAHNVLNEKSTKWPESKRQALKKKKTVQGPVPISSSDMKFSLPGSDLRQSWAASLLRLFCFLCECFFKGCPFFSFLLKVFNWWLSFPRPPPPPHFPHNAANRWQIRTTMAGRDNEAVASAGPRPPPGAPLIVRRGV